MRHSAPIPLAALAVLASAAAAAPPPPPPDFIGNAARLLTVMRAPDETRVEALFAPDVAVWANGRQVARGKDAWRQWRTTDRAHQGARLIGYSMSTASADADAAGGLLVVDTFDTVDRSELPPTFLADPRMATRSTFYQFGGDRLIHAVRIGEVAGFFIASH